MSHMFECFMSRTCLLLGGKNKIIMSRVRMLHVTCMNISFHTHECVISHESMCHVTCMDESGHTHEYVMSHV